MKVEAIYVNLEIIGLHFIARLRKLANWPLSTPAVFFMGVPNGLMVSFNSVSFIFTVRRAHNLTHPLEYFRSSALPTPVWLWYKNSVALTVILISLHLFFPHYFSSMFPPT